MSQLTKALGGLQQSQGLEVTGALDQKTMEALKKLGLVESSIGVAPGSHTKDAFDLAPSKNAQTTMTAPESVPTENAMDTLLTAMKSVLEGMLGEGAGATTKDAADAQTNAQVTAQGQAADTSDASHARRDGAGDKDPNGKGAESGDQSAQTGKAKKHGERSGRVGDGDEDEGSNADGEDQDGLSADGDEDGTEHEAGNASSGDDDEADRKRGHASTGDDDVDAGHYRVDSLESQIREALAALVRTEATANRATTYTFSVTLLRPGVYGPGQKAQEYLRLVVEDAGAFDDVWTQARENLQKVCNVAEPKANLPTDEEWAAALRRARVQ